MEEIRSAMEKQVDLVADLLRNSPESSERGFNLLTIISWGFSTPLIGR
jgi:hypothetical protein